jgi:hypothetical protein
MKAIAHTKIAKTGIIQEGSWGQRDLGEHASDMTLYQGDGGDLMIEWNFPSLEATEHVGLEMEGRRVVGYDGVMSFPRPAFKWLRSLGYRIARDVI